MTQDPNKKTLRSFQCRDYLWEIFEQMSQELECSVDYLVNEAMRQYARSRNYGVRSPSSPGMPRPQPSGAPPAPPPQQQQQQQPPPQPPPQQAGAGIPSLGGGQSNRSIPSAPPPPPQRSAPPPPPQPPQQQQPPQYGQQGGYGGGGWGGQQQPGYPPSQPSQPGYPQQGGGPYPPSGPQQAGGYPQQQSGPPSQPGYGGAPQPGGGAPPPLPGQQQQQAPQPQAGGQAGVFVIFNGQKIPINKAEFVIGRGSKTADLPIKDGNISRRHAAVVFQEGAFYMKDLGSTNGIEYQGRRVDSKRIDEGDVFQICDYELRFTYR